MTKETVVSRQTKFPYGTRLTLRYAGSIFRGTCMGTETYDPSYMGYMILKFDDHEQRHGHGAVNEYEEEIQKCWWIERGAQILKVENPFEPAGICGIL